MLRKKIPVERIEGVTKSFLSDEFVVHVYKDFDYRLVSVRKEEFINCLKMAVISVSKENLSIFGVKVKDLSKFTTTDRDADKGRNRKPGEEYLMDSENVLIVTENSKQESSSSSDGVRIEVVGDELLENAAELYQHREGQNSVLTEGSNNFDVKEEESEIDS